MSRHDGFFVLRTPLLPYSVVTDLSAGLEAADATDSRARLEALGRDRLRVRERLRALVTAPVVREAIFLAHPISSDPSTCGSHRLTPIAGGRSSAASCAMWSEWHRGRRRSACLPATARAPLVR